MIRRNLFYPALKNFKSSKPIELSVIMPFFRARDIAWVAFESLIRQTGVSFNWEIIIMEEATENPFGLANVKAYSKGLKRAGCAKIKYISLNQWMPLSAKWHFLIQQSDPRSGVICFHAADIYSGNKRLKNQHAVLTAGEFNWYKLGANVTYDIASNKHVKIKMNPDRTDTCCRATTRELAMRLPLANIRKGVDGWTFRSLREYNIKHYIDTTDIWKGTINVNGINNITLDRGRRIREVVPPFDECCESFANHVPADVLKKLRDAKYRIANHRSRVAQSNIKL